MTYISSERMREENISYENIDKNVKDRTTWAVGTGVLAETVKKYDISGSALDLGCGNGKTLLSLGENFSELNGIDILDILSPEAKSKVKFASADLNFEKLPHSENSLDLVTAFQIIEHLENPFLVMREAFRVLRPGKIFMFSVPNPFNISFRLKFLMTGNMPPWTEKNHHLLFLTNNVFKKTYLAHFDLLEAVYQRGSIPMWGRLRSVFGKKFIKKHAMVLPRGKLFGRAVCYILRKK
ncbi:MAG: class I SAM-dependent methyltransferase [Patescibacteria group bacterium]